MKLHKALKLRKKLTGEIAQLKHSIQLKNSYLEGSVDPIKYDVNKIYAELLIKIQDLLGLKYAINEANRDLQAKLYLIAEYKGLITFWMSVNVSEGVQPSYGANAGQMVYCTQYDELKRDEIIKEFQTNVDLLQEDIDSFNYTTEIPWDEFVPDGEPKPTLTQEALDNMPTTIKGLKKVLEDMTPKDVPVVQSEAFASDNLSGGRQSSGT